VGDGESEMVLGNPTVYQNASNELKSELERVLVYARQDGHYFLGLANIKNPRYKKICVNVYGGKESSGW
jgi:hypothetical protein